MGHDRDRPVGSKFGTVGAAGSQVHEWTSGRNGVGGDRCPGDRSGVECGNVDETGSEIHQTFLGSGAATKGMVARDASFGISVGVCGVTVWVFGVATNFFCLSSSGMESL